MMSTIWELRVPDQLELWELDAAEVKQVEERLGITFPTAYLKILEEKNGGYLVDQILYKVRLSRGEVEEIPLECFYGISSRDCEGVLSFRKSQVRDGLPEEVVVISNDDYGWVVLDYRKHSGNNPPITYLEPAEKVDERVAPDFETFLKSLRRVVVDSPEPVTMTDDNQLKETFTPKEVEEALKGLSRLMRYRYMIPSFERESLRSIAYYLESMGKRGMKDYEMVGAGLYYLNKQHHDVNWVIAQLIKLTRLSDFYLVFACVYHFYHRLKVEGVQGINEEKLAILLHELKMYPTRFFDEEEISVRYAINIEKLMKKR